MDLHERVMQILDGRIKMGAGEPISKNRVETILAQKAKMGAGKKKKSKRVSKKKPDPFNGSIVSKVPPMYGVPNSRGPKRTTKLASQRIENIPSNTRITEEMLAHHFPTSVPGMELYIQDKTVIDALSDLLKTHDMTKMEEIAIRKSMGGAKKESEWIKHVKKVQKQKGISYKDAMKVASKTYKKTKKSGKAKSKKCPCGGAASGKLTDAEKDYLEEMIYQMKNQYDKKITMPKTDSDKRKLIAELGKIDNYPFSEWFNEDDYNKDGSRKGRGRGGMLERSSVTGGLNRQCKKINKQCKNSWIDFVKEFAKLNKMSYKDALKAAAPYYTADT